MKTPVSFVRAIRACAILVASTGSAFAQNWQTTWGDDFDSGSIGPDWIYDIGTGSNGWGNNELQYYRSQNASVENGQLVITAKQESFGGKNYTSARLTTYGKQAFRYGKIEAKIRLPSFTGSWPAFWMLGQNIGSVGWPACGEIDVMEHVNTEGVVHGTVHWSDPGNAYASYSGVTAANVTNYRIYAVIWNSSHIRWYVDGVQYHEVNIAGGVNGTSEFHNPFYILLNFAIGGDWPGFTVNNAALPAKMYVDWVRVAKDFNQSNTFLVANRNSGKILRPQNSGTANNTPLVQWTSYVSDNVKWTLTPVGSGQYRLVNVASGRALSVDGASQNNNAICKLYDYFGGDQQKFSLDYKGNGLYSLVFVHSGKAMAVSGSSTADGAAIVQHTNSGAQNTMWRFKDF